MKIFSMKYKDRKYVVYETNNRFIDDKDKKVEKNSQVATTIQINILCGELN